MTRRVLQAFTATAILAAVAAAQAFTPLNDNLSNGATWDTTPMTDPAGVSFTPAGAVIEATALNYQRQDIAALNNDLSWVGQATNVTYSFTVTNFPATTTNLNYETHLLLVGNNGASAGNYIDYNATNVIYLAVYQYSDGVHGQVLYKTNAGSASIYAPAYGGVGTLLFDTPGVASGGVGTWGLTVGAGGTNITFFGPGFPAQTAALPAGVSSWFNQTVRLAVGVNPQNTAGNAGLATTISRAQAYLGSASDGGGGTVTNPPAGGNTGALGDTNIQYFGRWDFSNPAQYQAYWGGAYIKVNFSGTTAKINLGNVNNYYVKIDGGAWLTYSNASGTLNLTPTPLANGTHSLSVATGSDSSYYYSFKGLTLDAGATTSLPMVAPNLLEFIGDSITSGWTISQGDVSDYAWVCAEHLNSEHTQIAFPGIALFTGYGYNTDKTGMQQQYFKLQCTGYATDSNWDFSRYTPKVVVINIGQNDYSLGVNVTQFQSAYTNFLLGIRTNFPMANIFAMRPFSGGLAAQVLAAVNARIAAGDSRLHYVDTTGWLSGADFGDGTHPTVAGHIKAAGLLRPVLAPYVSGPAQTITGASVNGTGTAMLSYTTTTGYTYHVETTTHLLPATWSTVAGSVTNATGTAVTFTDKVSSAAAERVYRVVSP